jgi:toxin ParE1/3/4
MPRFRLSPQAERDIESILAWSQAEFGEKARLRYEALLLRALLDLADSPDRPGSQDRPELAPGARTYHLRHSRDRVKKSTGQVQRPRHFLLFRVLDDGTVEVGRVLHDAMDLARHLPDDYRNPDPPG